MATPAPLTAEIKFKPPLHPNQEHGTRLMTYAMAVKVILVFSKPWWNGHGAANHSGGIITDLQMKKIWFPPVQPKSGKEYNKSLLSLQKITTQIICQITTLILSRERRSVGKKVIKAFD